MILRNNTPKPKWFYYKIKGIPKKVYVSPYSELNVSEIEITEELNLNPHDESIENQTNRGKNFVNTDTHGVNVTETKTVEVLVYDALGNPVDGASVLLNRAGTTVYSSTTSSGFSYFTNLRKGDMFSLDASASGYHSGEVSVTINQNGTVSLVLNTFWYLPSNSEATSMSDNLGQQGVGSFSAGYYWTSSEESAEEWQPPVAAVKEVLTGLGFAEGKANLYRVRPITSYSSTTVYNLADVGAYGGWIFYITDLGGGNYKYYEAAPTDLPGTYAWSNVTNGSITKRSAIGTGYQNTLDIINQVGHVTSAALACSQYSV
jgi:hypothetical protein